MFNNNTQYINLIKTEQNIKIDYKLLNKDKIIQQEQSVFLFEDKNFSADAQFKIKALEKNNATTYISALCEDEDQLIITKDFVPNNMQTTTYFNTSHNIVLDNSKILNCKNFYNDGEIDYLLSPYNVLHDILLNDLNEKSLNILILNNKMYCVILDEQKVISYSCINTLSPYDLVDKTEFFDDEIAKQKLYEEMYLLELEENISSITSDFYEQNNNSYFIENINIYYSIKQVNDQQIKTLTDSLMIPIEYKQVNIDDIMFKLLKKNKQIQKESFISIRKKKSSNSLIYILIASVFVTLFILVNLFYFQEDETKNENIVKKDEIKKELKKIKKEKVIKEIALPLHKSVNTKIRDFIIELFDTIDSKSVLKEIQVQSDESTLVYSFKDENAYIKNLQPKLLKLYKNSQNVLSTNKNSIYTAIISNTNNLKNVNSKETKLYKPNKDYKFLNKGDALIYLKTLLKNENIQFAFEKNDKYKTYVFNISKNITSPNDFYDDIDKLNNQYYSIILSYPIEFLKAKKSLITNYTIQFNQIKKDLE